MHFEISLQPWNYLFLAVACAVVVTSPFLSSATQQLVHPYLAIATALVVTILHIKQSAEEQARACAARRW